MKKNNPKDKDLPTCPMNDGVVCDPTHRTCYACGWNPSIAKARINRYCSANKIQIPEEKSGQLT